MKRLCNEISFDFCFITSHNRKDIVVTGGKAGPLQVQIVRRCRPEGFTGAEVGVWNCYNINHHCAWLPQLLEGEEPAGNLLPLSSGQLGIKEGRYNKLAAEDGKMGLPL